MKMSYNHPLCVFCEQHSETVREEHVMPECFGANPHTLPSGLVCDRCNQYFGNKIEKPIAERPYFLQQRFANRIEGKKGKIAPVTTLHLPSCVPCELIAHADGSVSIGARAERDELRLVQSIRTQSSGMLVAVADPQPPMALLGRLLGKIGIETLASCWRGVAEFDATQKLPEGLQPLRRHVRFGASPEVWPVHIRRLYPANQLFPTVDGTPEQVIHEWDLAYVEGGFLLIVVCILGVEYVLDMTNPSTEVYEEWLKRHGGVSPLCSQVGRFEL